MDHAERFTATQFLGSAPRFHFPPEKTHGGSVTAVAQEAGAPAIRMGIALREARVRSGASVGEIASRFRGGETGRSHSYLYDVEKGRRFATDSLVRAYAEVCADPGLIQLRAMLASGDLESGPIGETPTADAYRVLRALEQRAQGLDSISPDDWTPYADGFDPGLLSEPYVVHGRQESIRAVTQLLSWAARSGRIAGDLIVVSSEEDAAYFESGPDAGLDGSAGLFRGTLLFQCIVECLLSRGTHVIHIRPPAQNSIAVQAQIDALITLLGFKGKYLPRDLDLRSPVPAHSILIPGVATVQFMASQSVYFCDSVLVTPFKPSTQGQSSSGASAQFDLLEAHLNRVSRGATPALEIVGSGTYPRVDFSPAELAGLRHAIQHIDGKLLELDSGEGRRCVFKAGFAAVTCPPAQQRARRQRFWEAHGKDGEGLDQWLGDLHATTLRRRDAYEANVRTYPHVDVITRQSLESFVGSGRFAPGPPGTTEADAALDDYLGLDVPTPAERIEHIQRVISDLDDYPNYELLIVDEDNVGALQGSGWAVKWSHEVPSVAFFESVRTRVRARGGFEQHYGACAITQEALLSQIAIYADREIARIRQASNRGGSARQTLSEAVNRLLAADASARSPERRGVAAS